MSVNQIDVNAVNERTKQEVPEFDLPVDESAPKAKPRVHRSAGDDSVCISCEG